MPAKSKSQQRFFGLLHAIQQGKVKAPSKDLAEKAKTISKQDVTDFAATQHKRLPEKVKAAFVQGFYKRAAEYGLSAKMAAKILGSGPDVTSFSFSDDPAGEFGMTRQLSQAGIFGTESYDALGGPARFILGHGAGSGNNYTVGPQAAGAGSKLTDIVDKYRPELEKAKLLALNSCNEGGCDIPKLLRDKGLNPERLAYGAPGFFNSSDTAQRAAAWAALEKRPWFLPSKQEFEGMALKRDLTGESTKHMTKAIGEVRPYIEPKYWGPAAALAGLVGLTGLGVWNHRRKKKKAITKKSEELFPVLLKCAAGIRNARGLNLQPNLPAKPMRRLNGVSVSRYSPALKAAPVTRDVAVPDPTNPNIFKIRSTQYNPKELGGHIDGSIGSRDNPLVPGTVALSPALMKKLNLNIGAILRDPVSKAKFVAGDVTNARFGDRVDHWLPQYDKAFPDYRHYEILDRGAGNKFSGKALADYIASVVGE